MHDNADQLLYHIPVHNLPSQNFSCLGAAWLTNFQHAPHDQTEVRILHHLTRVFMWIYRSEYCMHIYVSALVIKDTFRNHMGSWWNPEPPGFLMESMAALQMPSVAIVISPVKHLTTGTQIRPESLEVLCNTRENTLWIDTNSNLDTINEMKGISMSWGVPHTPIHTIRGKILSVQHKQQTTAAYFPTDRFSKKMEIIMPRQAGEYSF